MPDYLPFALIIVATYALIVAALIVTHRRQRRPNRVDDLMAIHDAVNPQWHEHEIEALRALFHADQTPQPERRRTR